MLLIERRSKQSWNKTVALVIDTNILLYAANEACPEHSDCRRFLIGCADGCDTCFLPENVIYEFLRVGTHPRVFPKPLRASEALKFLDALISTGNFKILGATQNHWKSLQALVRELGQPAGNFFFDVHTVALMREHGIRRIASADLDFAKFPGLDVVNPLNRRDLRD
jgi:toxin-antitoxin system PIN domain toxin